jgi:diaminohydroxyphosphoribosylaminopyrimidine deaminase/5-amino-6-(5-phosphoribosylamino)uracil reductase
VEDLYKRKIQSLIVEGGANLLQSFITKNLWDEARVFRSDAVFGEGIPVPSINGQIMERNQLTGDELTIFKNW